MILKSESFRFEAGAVVFDKDGTLVGGPRVWEKIFEKQIEVSSEMGLNVEAEMRRIFGIGSGVKEAPLALAYSSEETVLIAAAVWLTHRLGWERCRALAKEIVKLASERMTESELFGPLEGAKEILREISGIVPIAIVTSDSRKNTERMLDFWKMREAVDLIVTSDDVPNGKPEPDPLFRVCEKFGLPAGEIAVIGDGEADAEMAKRAGSFSIIVGPEPKGADAIVRSLADLSIEAPE